ncbi:hypothetical protein [Streptomyces pactum]|uniref:Uncharacterized protein n=1 Tax=Streptomyces pactum TaxID=68249 RepID=A0A1S6JAA9_9ACTN|nr:hypothetical protein [Streptomyces pactum]AQS68685.1 hypothetical protein B1H29_18690 [Streptomyces pactum]
MTTQPPPQGNPFAQGQPQAPQQPQGQNPFAQSQPGFPQQPGQPGFPQQGAPYAPVPPQPPRRNKFKLIKNIVIAVVVVGVAVGGYIASRDDATTAAVGDCMHRGSSSDSDPDLEVVDCGDAKAQYVVLAKVEGSYSALTAESKCSESAKDFQYSYTESGSGSDFLLCLKDYKK